MPNTVAEERLKNSSEMRLCSAELNLGREIGRSMRRVPERISARS